MCKTKIIGTSSFAASGGSALTNIIEEFTNIYSLGSEFECKFFTENILMLDIALKNKYDIDNAVKRFLYNAKIASNDHFYKKYFGNDFMNITNEYINSIFDWYMGAIHKHYDYELINTKEQKTFNNANKLYSYRYGNRKYNQYEPYKWEPSFTPFGKVYYSNGGGQEDFIYKTNGYINKIFSHFDQKNCILIDCLCSATDTTPKELSYYPNSKILIANRDPRDLYVINKELYGEWYMPTWNVASWIKYYKNRRQSISIQKKNNTDTILHLQFEELIYEYEESLNKIKQFLGFSDKDHTKKGKIFIPELSKTNTQVFRKYPQYEEDINKIEKELPEFCYNYNDNQIRYFSTNELVSCTNRETLEDIRKATCLFQKTGKLPFSNIKGAYIFSTLYSQLQSFKNRKGIASYAKGIIKFCFYVFIFPFDFLHQLCEIKKYQKENKNIKVEFK